MIITILIIIILLAIIGYQFYIIRKKNEEMQYLEIELENLSTPYPEDED